LTVHVGFCFLALLSLSLPVARSDLSPSLEAEARGEGEGEGDGAKNFKCSRAQGTYATLLEGLYSVSIPARVVIFYDCNVIISPAIAYDADFRRLAFAGNFTDASLEERGSSIINTAISFPCELYPSDVFTTYNYYICGYASQRSKTGARYFGRNFGINCPSCGSTGLLQKDGGSCTVKDDGHIKCFFSFTTVFTNVLLYTAELERVNDDVDDDIKNDVNNPKWDFKTCSQLGC